MVHADINASSVLEEAAFAHDRQETEFDIVVIKSQIAIFLFQGENALVVPSG